MRDEPKSWSRNFLFQAGSDFTASILRPGGRREADHLQGDMIARAEAAGRSTDLPRAAFCQNRRVGAVGAA